MSLVSTGRPLPIVENLNIKEVIEENFQKPSREEYVHYVLKNRFNKELYATNFESKLREIQNTTGKPVSLNSKRVYSLTPLHIGAVLNNIEGVRCLLNLGVSPNVKDDFGRTPYDYSKMYGYRDLKCLLKESVKPKQSLEAADNIQSSLFQNWKINVPNIPFEYKANSHDFGIEIKKLLFTKSSSESTKDGLYIRHLAENIKKIAEIEGFSLDFTFFNFFPRDSFIQTSNGLKKLKCSKNIKEAVERKCSYELMYNLDEATNYSFIAFGVSGGAAQAKLPAKIEFYERFKRKTKLPFYLEGGNYFILSNTLGEKKLLLGNEVLLLILNHLILDGYFQDENYSDVMQRISEELTDSEISTTLQEMYVQGLIKKSEIFPKGLISFDERLEIIAQQQLNTENGKVFNKNNNANFAVSNGYFVPIKLGPGKIKNFRKLASAYLAKKELVKQLIAKNFSVKNEDIHFIPKLDYHLDVFIHPGPSGSLFLQNYKMTVDFLEGIKKDKKKLNLTKNDLEILEKYLSIARKLSIQFHSLESDVTTKLKEAGFVVIPSPGIFYDECPLVYFDKSHSNKTQMKNVNFLNSITGWSSKTNRHYWITAGCTTGDRLSAILMENFRYFLKLYQKDLEVYFIGNDPKNPKDYSEIMKFLGHQSSRAGIHCMSMELETKSRAIGTDLHA